MSNTTTYEVEVSSIAHAIAMFQSTVTDKESDNRVFAQIWCYPTTPEACKDIMTGDMLFGMRPSPDGTKWQASKMDLDSWNDMDVMPELKKVIIEYFVVNKGA